MKPYMLNKIATASFILVLLYTNPASASTDDWQLHGTAQAFMQFYSGTSERDSMFNAGYYLMADYLDTSTIGAGYNYTIVNLSGNSDISEHLLYLTGRHSIFPDSLPGKVTFRLDGHLGRDTISTKSTTIAPSGGMGGGKGKGGLTVFTSTISEDTDISAIQPMVSFINFNKSFYADLGYAFSKYDSTSDITVTQLTPTVGFGWNDSYEWLQTRAYLIKLDEDVPAFKDDRFNSVEIKYTHWFSDAAAPRLTSTGVSLLAGDRVFAVDPDAGTIYSTSNRQTGSMSAFINWQYTSTISFTGLANYSHYSNDAAATDYTGWLLYFNLQHQW